MRVLQIGLSKLRGGVESCILNYAVELKKYNVFFDYADIYGDGIAIEKEINELGGIIYTIPNYKKNYLKAKNVLKKIIIDGSYDNVHINMLSAANLMPVKIVLELGIVPIVHSHNSDTAGFLRKLFHECNKIELKKLKVINIACGQQAGLWMFGTHKFKIIPNAIDLECFQFSLQKRKKLRFELGINDEKLVVGFVGRLSEQKNPLYLINILDAVKKIKKDVLLLVVGSGPLEKKIIDYAKKKFLLNDTMLVGQKNNLSNWYAAMDVFVLPSKFEGMPVVAIEAQVSGLPCVFSENITKEVLETELTYQCKITDDAKDWALAIMDGYERRLNRECASIAMQSSIYNIKNSAVELKEIYEKQKNESFNN